MGLSRAEKMMIGDVENGRKRKRWFPPPSELLDFLSHRTLRVKGANSRSKNPQQLRITSKP